MSSIYKKFLLILFLFFLNINNLFAQAKPFKIGYFLLFSAAPFIYAEENGHFKKEGLEIKLIPYKNLTDLSTDFYNGKIDAAIFPVPIIFSYTLGLLPNIPAEKVKVVMTSGVNGGCMVRIDSSIKSPKDLRGKIVASFPQLCFCYPLFKYFLKHYGIDPEKDVKYLIVSFNELFNYVRERKRLEKELTKNRDNKELTRELMEKYKKLPKISAFLIPEPFATFVKNEVDGEIIAMTRIIWRDHPSAGLVIKEKNLTENKIILEKIIGVIGKVSLTLDLPQNRDNLVKVLLKSPYNPPEFTYPILKEAFKAGRTDYLVFPYKSSAIAWIEILKELKMLPSNVDSYRLGEETFASEFARAALKKAGVPVPPSDYRPEVIMGEVKNFRR